MDQEEERESVLEDKGEELDLWVKEIDNKQLRRGISRKSETL